jgi:mRNA interferase MazF
MEITRGDIVVAVLPGDYGKGRPAVVVQSDAFNATHASIVVCPITTHLVDAPLFRVALASSAETGLEAPSQVMADKVMAIKRERIARVIGRVEAMGMREVDHALQLWLASG